VWRSIKVLTILLLATAAAAGAGDNVKWSKSKKIEYFPYENTFRDVNIGEEKVQDKYMVSWYPVTRMNPVEFVDVTYISWEMYCVALKTHISEGKISENEAEGMATEDKDKFLNLAVFAVAVSVNDSSMFDLLEPGNWTAEAEVGGSVRETTVSNRLSFGLPALFFSAGTSNEVTFSGWRSLTWHIWGYTLPVATFFVAFKPEENWNPKSGMKLILRCNDVTRGFQWRFEQD